MLLVFGAFGVVVVAAVVVSVSVRWWGNCHGVYVEEDAGSLAVRDCYHVHF